MHCFSENVFCYLRTSNEDTLSFIGQTLGFPQNHCKNLDQVFQQDWTGGSGVGKMRPKEGASLMNDITLEAISSHPLERPSESFRKLKRQLIIIKARKWRCKHLPSKVISTRKVCFCYYYSFYYSPLFLLWSHSICTVTTILTLLRPQYSLFSTEPTNTMESTLSTQMSPITDSDQNYLHIVLLELWRKRVRQRERGRRTEFSLLLRICVSILLSGRWQDMADMTYLFGGMHAQFPLLVLMCFYSRKNIWVKKNTVSHLSFHLHCVVN